MAAALALVAAFLFALAAALQQKGALNLPTISLARPSSLLRLVGQTMWLVGTLALLTGYVFQAAALDRGRLAIIQPLLVTTVVFALPLGYLLTVRFKSGWRTMITPLDDGKRGAETVGLPGKAGTGASR